MQQVLIRLPKNQIEWLKKQRDIYGSRSAAIRKAIQEAMDRDGKGVKHGR